MNNICLQCNKKKIGTEDYFNNCFYCYKCWTDFDKSLKTKDDVVYEMKLRFDIKDDIDLSNSLKIKIIRDIYRLCVLHIDKFKDDYGFIKAINKSRICVSDELNYIDNIYNDFELKNLNFWLSKINKYFKDHTYTLDQS